MHWCDGITFTRDYYMFTNHRHPKPSKLTETQPSCFKLQCGEMGTKKEETWVTSPHPTHHFVNKPTTNTHTWQAHLWTWLQSHCWAPCGSCPPSCRRSCPPQTWTRGNGWLHCGSGASQVGLWKRMTTGGLKLSRGNLILATSLR